MPRPTLTAFPVRPGAALSEGEGPDACRSLLCRAPALSVVRLSALSAPLCIVAGPAAGLLAEGLKPEGVAALLTPATGSNAAVSRWRVPRKLGTLPSISNMLHLSHSREAAEMHKLAPELHLARKTLDSCCSLYMVQAVTVLPSRHTSAKHALLHPA